jgi:hypothetical protein
MREYMIVTYCKDCNKFRPGMYTCKIGQPQDKRHRCKNKDDAAQENKEGLPNVN